MKKKILLLALLPLFLVGCGTQTNNPDNKGDSEASDNDNNDAPDNQDDTNEDNPNTDNPDTPVNNEACVTYSVDFSNVEEGKSDADNFTSKMVSNLNGENDFVSSVAFEGTIQINSKKQTTAAGENIIRTLNFGTQKSDGVLIINFKETLKSLTIYASAQYSAYSNGSNYAVTMDDENILYVNNESWDLSPEDKTVVPETQEKTFDINASSVRLEGKAKKRVFVYKLDFTFELQSL